MSQYFLKVDYGDDGSAEVKQADLLKLRKALQNNGVSAVGAQLFVQGLPVPEAKDRKALADYMLFIWANLALQR